MTDRRMVRIEWLDSHVYGGWHSIGEWRDMISAGRLRCESVGYVIIEHDEYIVLAQTRGNPISEESWADTVQIPRVSILTILQLGVNL
jgi:hypothetical protein